MTIDKMVPAMVARQRPCKKRNSLMKSHVPESVSQCISILTYIAKYSGIDKK